MFVTDHKACLNDKSELEGNVSDTWFCGGSCEEVLLRFKFLDSDYATKNPLDLASRKCFQYSVHEFKSLRLL